MHLYSQDHIFQDKADEKIARIFATNFPFCLVQYPQFHRIVEKLKPGYTPPARQEMADKVTAYGL